jgi:hypothetical protein
VCPEGKEAGPDIALQVLVTVTAGIAQSVPCTATIFSSVVRLHMSSNHSLFIHRNSLANTKRHVVAKEGETWREMSVRFAGEEYLSYSAGNF